MIIQRIENGPFFVNTYIIGCEETRRGIVVDPGHDVDRIIEAMRASGLTFEAVVNTHAHLDHVAGVAAVKRSFGIPFELDQREVVFLDALPETCASYGLPAIERPDVDSYLEAGGTRRVGKLAAKLVAAPGHSPGSLLMNFGDHVLVGDVVFQGSVGRTDLPLADPAPLARSIREHVLTLPDHIALHPGHGPSTTVGVERRTNPFLGTAE